MKHARSCLFVFLFFLVFIGFVQFQVPEMIGQDGYLHMRMASIMGSEGFIDVFPYTTESILSNNYANLQWGLHALLLPFTLFGLMLGGKLAAVFFTAVLSAVFYFYLKKHEIVYPFFWSFLLLITSVDFLYRLMLPRALAIGLTLLVLTLYFLEHKKYWALSLVSLLGAWLYPGFVIQAGLVMHYGIYSFIIDKNVNWKLLTFPFGGTLLALVVNPYFPNNLSLLFTQIFGVNLGGNAFNVEWQAWSFSQFFSFNVFALLLVTVALVYGYRSKQMSRQSVFYLMLAFVFFLGMLKTRRMHEFFVPFAVLFSAHALNPFIKSIAKSWKVVLLVGLFAFGVFQFFGVQKEITNSHFLPWYYEGALWLHENVGPGEKVFVNGYVFSYLFFYNPQLRYTHGVDLTYAELYDKDRFGRYMEVLQGKDPGYNAIVNDYRPDYVFVGKIRQDVALFQYIIRYEDDFELLYEDKSVGILKVK